MALATLSIDLEARLTKLQQDLDKAGRLAEKNAEQIRAAYARVGAVTAGLGATIASAFAGFSVVAFVKGNAEAIDALNDVKDATGATIENISGLEQVALKTGTTLATVSDVLIKFNRGLSEGNPNGPITQTLKSIGLSADELRKLDPAEALRVTAMALDGYADDANKARIIQELFGKSVKEAAPFLHDLAEAGELNGKITTQQAEAAEKFNKQLFELHTNSVNSARAIASELIPRLNALYETYKKFGVKGLLANALGADDLSRRKAELSELNAAISGAAEAVDRYAKGLEKTPNDIQLITGMDRARARLALLQSQALAASAALKKAADVADGRDQSPAAAPPPKPSAPGTPSKPDAAALQEEKRYENLLKKIKERLAIANQELATGEKLTESERLRLDVESELASAKFTDAHRAAIRAILDRAVAAGKLRERQLEAAQLNEQEARATANYARSLDDQNRSLREQNEEIGLNLRQVEALRIARLEDLATRKEEQLATLKLFSADSDQYAQMQLNIAALRDQIKLRKEAAARADEISRDPAAGIKAALDEYNESVVAVGASTKSAFTSTIQSAEDSLLSFFRTGELNAGKFADEVIAQILRIAVVKPLVNFGANVVGSFLGIPGFASGGDHGGGLRIVGENGPELEATGAARIFNADQTRQILKGGGGGLQVTWAPSIIVDSRSDRAQVLADIEASNRRHQSELLQFLKAKGAL